MTWREPVTRGSLLLMEAMWTYALVAFFVAIATEGGKPSFTAVLLVVSVSFAISRAFQSSELSLGVIRVWGTILSLLIFYAIVRVDFFGDLRLWDFNWANDVFYRTEETFRESTQAVFGVPTLWFFWMRGILRGQQQLGWDNVLATFGIGVIILAVVLVFHGGTDAPALVGQIAIPYVAVGLIAIALAHSARAEDEAGKPFTTTWILTIGGGVIVLASIAALLALFDLGAATSGARSAGDFLLSVLGDVGYYLAWPFLKALELLFIASRWLFYLVLGQPDPQPMQPPPSELQQCLTSLRGAGVPEEEALRRCMGEPPERTVLPAWVDTAIRATVTILAIGILLLVTALFFNRFQKRRRLGELKESTYQEGRLASDLGELLNSLLGRLRPNIQLSREHRDAVRKLYFEMLHEASGRGIHRRPGETPLELSPTLEERFGGNAPRQVTDAFDDVRYGARTYRDEEARRLREEWESLRRQHGD
jgi:hypothetical protein